MCSRGRKISLETISVGHFSSLLGLEIMWVQDPRFCPHSSLKLSTNVLRKINSLLTSKVAFQIERSAIMIPRKTIVAHANLVLEN